MGAISIAVLIILVPLALLYLALDGPFLIRDWKNRK